MKIPFDEDARKIIGLGCLVLAAAAIATGCSLTWGATGALIGFGITLAIYAVGFFASTAE